MLNGTRTFYILSNVRTLAANSLSSVKQVKLGNIKNGVQNTPFVCYLTVTPTDKLP